MEYTRDKGRHIYDFLRSENVEEEEALVRISRRFGKEEEMRQVLDSQPKGFWNIFRRSGRDRLEILHGICLSKPEPQLQQIIEGKYVLMPRADNYVLGVHALQKACRDVEEKEGYCPHPQFVLDDGSRIYRPLAFGENLVARLQDESLFDRWLDSCTGIVYKKESTKFKIVPVCKELITISKRVKEAYLRVNYADFDYEEFDSSKVRCNILQSRKDAKQDPLWLASVNGNKDLFSDYVDDVFDRLKEKDREEGMRFWIRKNPDEDELRALFVSSISYNSNADDLYLNNNACFLRVAQ